MPSQACEFDSRPGHHSFAMLERTLVTGFGPFQDVADNPSAVLAEGCGRRYQILDVSYDGVEDFIFHLDPSTFDRLLLLGVASKRTHVSPELFARNQYGKQIDVCGRERTGVIERDAPLLIRGSLWNEVVVADMAVRHLHSVRVSMDAGTYLCNFTYFKCLQAFPCKKVGFLHVPPFAAVPEAKQREILDEILAEIEL